MYSDIEKSFYIRVHEETYPASDLQMKKEIFYEITPVSAMQKGIKLTSDLISEADIMRAFSNVVCTKAFMSCFNSIAILVLITQ